MGIINAIIDIDANFINSIDEFALEAPGQFLRRYIILQGMNTDTEKIIVWIAEMSIFN